VDVPDDGALGFAGGDEGAEDEPAVLRTVAAVTPIALLAISKSPIASFIDKKP
jgi:hypothetical protein